MDALCHKSKFSFTIPRFAGVLFCVSGIFRHDCWKYQVLTSALVTDIDFVFHGIEVSLISNDPVRRLENGQLDKTQHDKLF